MSGVLA